MSDTEVHLSEQVQYDLMTDDEIARENLDDEEIEAAADLFDEWNMA